MKCTICQSTGFHHSQCLGCGIMIDSMPAKVKRGWDNDVQWDSEHKLKPVRRPARVVRECDA